MPKDLYIQFIPEQEITVDMLERNQERFKEFVAGIVAVVDWLHTVFNEECLDGLSADTQMATNDPNADNVTYIEAEEGGIGGILISSNSVEDPHRFLFVQAQMHECIDPLIANLPIDVHILFIYRQTERS